MRKYGIKDDYGLKVVDIDDNKPVKDLEANNLYYIGNDILSVINNINYEVNYLSVWDRESHRFTGSNTNKKVDTFEYDIKTGMLSVCVV